MPIKFCLGWRVPHPHKMWGYISVMSHGQSLRYQYRLVITTLCHARRRRRHSHIADATPREHRRHVLRQLHSNVALPCILKTQNQLAYMSRIHKPHRHLRNRERWECTVVARALQCTVMTQYGSPPGTPNTLIRKDRAKNMLQHNAPPRTSTVQRGKKVTCTNTDAHLMTNTN